MTPLSLKLQVQKITSVQPDNRGEPGRQAEDGRKASIIRTRAAKTERPDKKAVG